MKGYRLELWKLKIAYCVNNLQNFIIALMNEAMNYGGKLNIR